MGLTVAELAVRIGGRVQGDGAAVVTGMAGLKDAEPGDVSFLANPRYAAQVPQTRAAAVIVNEDWQGACPCALIRVKSADAAFAALAAILGPPPVRPAPGVHPTAVLAPDVALGAEVSIGPHCVLESGARVGDRTALYAGCYVGHGASIGSDCLLYPRVSLRERVSLGNRVIVHNGAVIGSDGFGYTLQAGAWRKIPQIGTVEVGDDAEIGANVTIDRARFGKTVIGPDVKIDNLVQVAHNVRIGAHTAIAAQAGISGSTSIGQYVQLGGQAGLAGHIQVGDRSVIGAQSGVTKDVPPATFVSGYPAMPHDEARKAHAHMMRLPELKKRVAELERQVAELKKIAEGGRGA